MAEGVNVLKKVYVGNRVHFRHVDGLLYPGRVVKVGVSEIRHRWNLNRAPSCHAKMDKLCILLNQNLNWSVSIAFSFKRFLLENRRRWM